MSFFDPFGQSGEAKAVDGVHTFVGLSVAEVVPDLVLGGGSAFSNVGFRSIALDLPDSLVGGPSTDDGVPGLLPWVPVGLQAPSFSERVHMDDFGRVLL